MRIIPKPITLKHRPKVKPIAVITLTSKAPREDVTKRAYQQLVTSQNVHPDRAKELLGLSEK